MESTDIETMDETLQRQNSRIIKEMELFVFYLENFIEYASIILTFPYLTEEARSTTQHFLNHASNIRTTYKFSLDKEKVAELESKKIRILEEIELLDLDIIYREDILDQFLVFMDNKPCLKMQFKANKMISVSSSATC